MAKPRSRSIEMAKKIMNPGESIISIHRQSFLASLSPNVIMATDRRIIVINHSFWGLYTGHNIFSTSKINIAPYKNIVSVSMATGKVLSSIHITLLGLGAIENELGREWELNGLDTQDARDFLNIINQILESGAAPLPSAQASTITPPTTPSYASLSAKEDSMKAAFPEKKNSLIGNVKNIFGYFIILLATLGIIANTGVVEIPFLKNALELSFTDSVILFIVGIIVLKFRLTNNTTGASSK